MKSKDILGTSLSNSKDFSKDLSKESFSRRQNHSVQLPKDYALETKDRVTFGLCNYEDIDKYFNELCEESNIKLSAVKKVADFTKNSVSKGRSHKSPTGRLSGQESPSSALIRGALKVPSKTQSNSTSNVHVALYFLSIYI